MPEYLSVPRCTKHQRVVCELCAPDAEYLLKDVQEDALVERVGYGGGLFKRGSIVASGDGVHMLNTEGRHTGQVWPVDARVRLRFAAKCAVPETVNHPPHYGGADNPYEAIKVIEAWQLGFCLGNAIKYISRAGKKGAALEDLKKAAWHIAREIARLEGT